MKGFQNRETAMPDLLVSPDTKGNIHVLFETALKGERIRKGRLFSFEDLDSTCGSRECVMHNRHGGPLAGTQSAFRFLGCRNCFLLPNTGCPELAAAGWKNLCSATMVIPQMAVKRDKREGNALNPLEGRNVAGNSLETNPSESLKCNTLASGKLCQFLGRTGWSRLTAEPTLALAEVYCHLEDVLWA